MLNPSSIFFPQIIASTAKCIFSWADPKSVGIFMLLSLKCDDDSKKGILTSLIKAIY